MPSGAEKNGDVRLEFFEAVAFAEWYVRIPHWDAGARSL
jgi:hypothetical protein